MVYQNVTRNSNLSPAAKGVYAYLAAFSGASNECYPSVDTITKELGIGKDTFYRHINALVAAGVVEKAQSIGNDGKFGRTVYRLTHKVVIHDFPLPQNRDTVISDTESKETINNSIEKEQYLKNNSISCSPDAERETLSEENQPSEPDKKTTLEQAREDFEKIYAVYPKKVGKAKAFEYYRGYVGKGRIINGTRYRLDRKEVYLAVVSYVRQMEEEGTQLQFYKNFDTFMNKAVLDYLPERSGSHDCKS